MHATVMVMHYEKKKKNINWEKAGSVPALYSKYNILQQIFFFHSRYFFLNIFYLKIHQNNFFYFIY
jgi:hypothetical protein